jgi:transglutaminase-like putative cysteine protease
MKSLLLLAAAALLSTSSIAATPIAATLSAVAPKSVEATYIATIGAIPPGLPSVRVWIPLPVSRGVQRVSDITIDSPYSFKRKHDDANGNDYAYAEIAQPPAGDLAVKVHFKATRAEESLEHPAETKASHSDLARALQADRRVTLSPRIRALANDITKGKTGTIEQAQAIYDYLLLTMTYDKTTPGWGEGDSERACDVHAGNCTDFHSLFMSLARASGIPARFVIGFPLTAKDGKVQGYHCWAEFWMAGRGWIPVDPSEASKSSDPAVRTYLFGHLDPARLQFTIGRDLWLTPRTAEPLNYFIYPHAEAAGTSVGKPAIELQFHDVAGTAMAAR